MKRKKREMQLCYNKLCATRLGVAVVHSAHLHHLFENDRYFSHLSTLERELSFRTEMGFYYSYYKTMVTAPSFFDGLQLIFRDNITEYPSTINTLQRFNLYPEIFLGGLFRTWRTFLSVQGSSGVECFQISRGLGQLPVTACNGLGDPAYFYVWCVFAFNGFMASVIFILGSYLSENLFGGILSVTYFFFNHGEATRVMWTPPLRESFAMPFFLLQLLFLTHCIRQQSPTLIHYCMVTVASLAFLLPWQFSQFTLVSQSFSLLLLHSCRLLPSARVCGLFYSIVVALVCNIFLQFGNSLLLTSLLPSCIAACLFVVHCQRVYDCIPWRTLKMCFEVLSALIIMFVLKLLINSTVGGSDDAHISAIFLSKFTSYSDFHTQLYTCSPEFDFLSLDYVIQLCTTLLLPAALIASLLISISLFRHLYKGPVSEVTFPHSLAEQTYHVLQCGAFIILAVLIMRLKLFLTPQLCLLVGFLAKSKFLPRFSPRLTICLLLFGGSFKGLYNLWQQWSIIGEFNNPELEELVQWANNPASLPEHVVFAGAMPTMAALKLSTLHPIVNHPHYEDSSLRIRTKAVYTVYSRKSPAEIHNILAKLLVTHVVVEEPWCVKRYRQGCSFSEVWDKEDPTNQDKPQFCQLIHNIIPDQFKLVFSNNIYKVLQLL